MKRVRLASGVLQTSAAFILLGVAILVAASLNAAYEPLQVQKQQSVVPVIRPFPPSQPLSHVAPRVLGARTTQPLDCRQVACLALTFDDGPDALITPQVLSTLERYQVPASFFVVGKRVDGNQALLMRMHHDGDEVQSHSWSHPNLTTQSAAQIKEQFDLSALAIEDSGVPKPTLLRPPYGAVNQAVIDASPVPLAMWNEDPKDWHPGITAPQVVQNVEAGAKPGGVVDMHDAYQSTASALPQIITDLRARGFHFVTFSQLTQPDLTAHTEYFGLKAQ